ncbi:MAG: ABC transporter ATP-binding protein [Candidatus Paceibacterota bacterium]|jgi:ATP-binding cassette subfamily B protein
MAKADKKADSGYASFKKVLVTSWRVAAFAWKHDKSIVIGMVGTSLLLAIAPFIQSGISAVLVNDLVSGATTPTVLWALAFGFALTLFVPDIVSSLRKYFERRNYIDLGKEFQLLYLKKKSSIDIQQFEDPEFQDLINKAEDRDVWPIVNMSEIQFNLLRSLTQVAVAVVILAQFNWKICLLVAISVIPRFLTQIKYGKDAWGIWDAETEVRRRHNDLKSHFDNKTWLVELKLFQNVRHFFAHLSKILNVFGDKQKAVEKKRLLFESLSTVVFGLIIGGVAMWIIYRVAGGFVEVGTMLFLLASMDRFQSALIDFLSEVSQQQDRSTYADNLFRILDSENVLYRSKTPVSIGSVTPRVVFENVSFAYPRSEKVILRNISLTLEPGEKFALVGENGAGKTTFVKLLCRIYDPTEGRILVNGKDLREIDIEEWYSTLGILFQDYASYNFPVKEAIALGRSDAPFSLERVVEAAQSSDSESFILEWKDGYEQMLGVEFAGGVDPSKGQKQRLAIARLFHRKAGLMILDEPTAAIDAEAEMKIFERIEGLTSGQTVILISHKFSTVRKADRICVFEDGCVAELGSHRELVAHKGIYARLFALQAKDYE